MYDKGKVPGHGPWQGAASPKLSLAWRASEECRGPWQAGSWYPGFHYADSHGDEGVAPEEEEGLVRFFALISSGPRPVVVAVVGLDARLEVHGAGGAPQRRAPSPRERGCGRGFLGWGEVEDAQEEVVGEVGQAVGAAGHGLTYVGGDAIAISVVDGIGLHEFFLGTYV